MGQKRNVYKMLFGECRGERPLGRLGHGGEDNIKMNLKDTGCVFVAWIHLAHNRVEWLALVNIGMNL
jgi:hypothetical protein